MMHYVPTASCQSEAALLAAPGWDGDASDVDLAQVSPTEVVFFLICLATKATSSSPRSAGTTAPRGRGSKPSTDCAREGAAGCQHGIEGADVQNTEYAHPTVGWHLCSCSWQDSRAPNCLTLP